MTLILMAGLRRNTGNRVAPTVTSDRKPVQVRRRAAWEKAAESGA